MYFFVFWVDVRVVADLVARRLVRRLPKAHAENGTGNTGNKGHQREEGDGVDWTCDGAGKQRHDLTAFQLSTDGCGEETAEMTYLI